MAENTDETTVEPEPVEAVEAEQAEETFPRSNVEELRQENAKYRQRAQRADDLAQRLHKALVAATGRLADPEDLPFDEAHLEDDEALAAAVDDLLARNRISPPVSPVVTSARVPVGRRYRRPRRAAPSPSQLEGEHDAGTGL